MKTTSLVRHQGFCFRNETQPPASTGRWAASCVRRVRRSCFLVDASNPTISGYLPTECLHRAGSGFVVVVVWTSVYWTSLRWIWVCFCLDYVCWPVFNFMSAFSFNSWTKNVTHCSHLFCLFNIFFWFGMFSRQTLLVVPCILASYIITCDALLNNCMIIHHEWPHEALQMRPS